MPHLEPTRRNAWVRLWTLLVLAVGAFGIWASWQYLTAELRRLEPWKLAAVFCGDAVALLWFVRFAFAHLLLNRPLLDEPAGARARTRVVLFVASMIAALALDVGMTIYLHVVEQQRYELALPATADVHGMSTHHGSKGRNYTFDCTWRHPETGSTHPATLRIHASRDRMNARWDFPPMVASAMVDQLLKDQAPANLPIRYDPAWPGRAWIEGVSDDENGLFYTSLFVHFGQAFAVALITIIAWGRAFGAGGMHVWPWWLELGKIIPTAAQLLVIAFVGTLMLAFGS
jgi:hypothetical protein